MAVAEVVQAHDIADFGEPDFTAADLLDDWLRPRFDLATDAWVVGGPTGRIVGYGYVWESQPDRELEADAYVLPEYAGRGLGGRLLEMIETRAGAIASGRPMTLAVSVSRVNEGKRHLLVRRGFALARTVLRMRIDLTRQPDQTVETPTGITIGPFDPADDAAVRVVWLDAYASHGRYSPRRMNEWLESRFAHPAYDPTLWRVAKTDRGEVLGAIVVFDVQQTGYTSTVALRSDARGRGIGPALLRSAFAALRDRGQMRVLVSLDADTEPRIVSLYESVGMRIHERHDVFVKEL
ncbi:MAG: GNAT family N-acetyltransferase [Acidimicrobiia bacterium]